MPAPGGTALLPTMNEEEALERCRRGEDGPEHGAFHVLYATHRPSIERFLGRMLGNRHAVEDALQDTFVRLHRSLPTLERGRPLRPYLFAIARHVALNHLRAAAKSKAAGPLAAEPPAPASGAGPERTRATQEALDALEPQHRSLILLRFTHRLSQEELAEALDCTTRTVRNRLRVAAALFERELVRRGVLERRELDGRDNPEVRS